jgi:hypothetical protein
MDRYRQVHILFLGLVPAAIIGGFTYGSLPIGLNVFLLAFFLIALRAKFYVDDEAYFADVDSGELPGGIPFVFGIVVALISWLLWVFAGFYVKDIERSSILMILTMIPSTVWIVAAMVKRGAYAEQVPWLFFNLFYIGGFFLLATRTESWNPFHSHIEAYTTAVLASLVLVFLLDFVASRVLENTRYEARKTRESCDTSTPPGPSCGSTEGKSRPARPTPSRNAPGRSGASSPRKPAHPPKKDKGITPGRGN